MTHLRPMLNVLSLSLALGLSGSVMADIAPPPQPQEAPPVVEESPAADLEKAEEKRKAGLALDAAVERVQKAYEGIKALRADVTQTSRLSSLAREEVQKGNITMAKPGRMRWVFTEPVERLFVSDGKTLYMYSKDDNQVIVQPLQGQSGIGVDFLLGLGDIRKDFEVASVVETEYHQAGRDALALTPKKPTGAISRMIFSVDGDSGLVQEVWTFDGMGNRTHLQFDGLTVNPELDNTQFEFTPPEGAEVLEAGGF